MGSEEDVATLTKEEQDVYYKEYVFGKLEVQSCPNVAIYPRVGEIQVHGFT